MFTSEFEDEQLCQDTQGCQVWGLTSRQKAEERFGKRLRQAMLFQGKSGGVDDVLATIARDLGQNSIQTCVILGNSNGKVALHMAAWTGNVEGLNKLLSLGAAVNALTIRGHSALHFAASKRREAALALLLEQKAFPRVITSKGETPLLLAQKAGAGEDTLRLLREAERTAPFPPLPPPASHAAAALASSLAAAQGHPRAHWGIPPTGGGGGGNDDDGSREVGGLEAGASSSSASVGGGGEEQGGGRSGQGGASRREKGGEDATNESSGGGGGEGCWIDFSTVIRSRPARRGRPDRPHARPRKAVWLDCILLKAARPVALSNGDAFKRRHVMGWMGTLIYTAGDGPDSDIEPSSEPDSTGDEPTQEGADGSVPATKATRDLARLLLRSSTVVAGASSSAAGAGRGSGSGGGGGSSHSTAVRVVELLRALATSGEKNPVAVSGGGDCGSAKLDEKFAPAADARTEARANSRPPVSRNSVAEIGDDGFVRGTNVINGCGVTTLNEVAEAAEELAPPKDGGGGEVEVHDGTGGQGTRISQANYRQAAATAAAAAAAVETERLVGVVEEAVRWAAVRGNECRALEGAVAAVCAARIPSGKAERKVHRAVVEALSEGLRRIFLSNPTEEANFTSTTPASRWTAALSATGPSVVLERLLCAADLDAGLAAADALGLLPPPTATTITVAQHSAAVQTTTAVPPRPLLEPEAAERVVAAALARGGGQGHGALLAAARVARRIGDLAALQGLLGPLGRAGLVGVVEAIGDEQPDTRDAALASFCEREDWRAGARAAVRWGRRDAAAELAERATLAGLVSRGRLDEAREYAAGRPALLRALAIACTAVAAEAPEGIGRNEQSVESGGQGSPVADRGDEKKRSGEPEGAVPAAGRERKEEALRLPAGWRVVWVDTVEGVAAAEVAVERELRGDSAAGGAVGMDTEWRDPRPCSLIQLALRRAGLVYLIDALPAYPPSSHNHQCSTATDDTSASAALASSAASATYAAAVGRLLRLLLDRDVDTGDADTEALPLSGAIVGFGFRGDLERLRSTFPGLGSSAGRHIQDCQALAASRRQALGLMAPPPSQDKKLLPCSEDSTGIVGPASTAVLESDRRGGRGGGRSCGRGPPALGLSRVCEAALGRPVDKSARCSDWDRRPLRPTQRAYAALDAQVLLALRDRLLALPVDEATLDSETCLATH